MTTIHAHVLVPAFHQYRLEGEIDGWVNIANDGCQHFVTDVADDISCELLWKKVNSLRMILLTLFLDDLTPRMIKSFSYGQHANSHLLKLFLVLGNSQEFEPREDMESFFISGEIFNGGINNNPFYSPDIDKLKTNHAFLVVNPGLARNLDFLVDSLIIFNRYFNSQNYNNQNDLLKGIILFISALEGIFLNNQENSADISFKFQFIGSILYEKYADPNFIRSFGMNQRKFSRKEFADILKELYGLRSKIAHGTHERLFAAKEWRKFLTLKNVYFEDNMSVPDLYKSISLACGLLQKHIMAIIIGAEEDILLGANIINKIKIIEESAK